MGITQNNNTALMIFSLSAEREAERKPLFGNGRKTLASNFFEILIKDTIKMASNCGVQVFHIDENQQKGSDFASLYTNAFSDIFKLGFKNVISIGNDSPGLTVQHLKTALTQIESKGAVFGPATDGGVYLLGINQSYFDAVNFEKLPWQKSNLYAKLVSDFQNKNAAIYCLDFLVDIDSAKDMLFYAEENPNSFLAYYILNNILQLKSQFHFYLLKNFSEKAHVSLPSRAPPIFALVA